MRLMSRDGVWLVVALVLGLFGLSQYRIASEVRSNAAELARQFDEIYRQLVEAQQAGTDPAALIDTIHQYRDDVTAAGVWLDEYYSAPEGLQRPDGLWRDGRPDFDGIGAWLLDIYLTERVAGRSDEEAKLAIVDAIESSEEWRQKHPVTGSGP